MFETTNSVVTRSLGIKKGTGISRYLQLYNAFFVSAMVHHIGALNCPYSTMARYQFYFFMIQPVAISLEDLAIFLGKKAGLRDTCKYQGMLVKSSAAELTCIRENQNCRLHLGWVFFELLSPICMCSLHGSWSERCQTPNCSQI